MSRTEFDNIVLPALVNFSFIPDQNVAAWGIYPIPDALWLLFSTIYREQAEGKDRLLGWCDVRAVAAVLSGIREVYESLMTFQEAGIISATLMVGRKACAQCKGLDRSVLYVADLIVEIRSGKLRFPHEVPLEDEAGWCSDHWMHEIRPPGPNNDPEFAAYLEKLLDR